MKLDEIVRIYCSLRAVASVTEKGYLDASRVVDNPTIGELTLLRLQGERDRAQSPFSWNSTLGKLRAVIRFAIQSGWADPDHPIFKVKRLNTGLIVRKEISNQDRKTLLLTIKKSPSFEPKWFWTTLFDVLYYSGIRRKQLCYLRWNDLDLNASTILLRAAGAKNKRERLLPLHPALVKTLSAYRSKVVAAMNDKPLDSSQQVFSFKVVRTNERHSEELTGDKVTAFFYSLAKESGIHITAHLLRHSFATKISREIPNIKMVQLLLNHDRPDTTMRYIHPTLEDMRSVMSLPLTKATN
jgi:integrase